MKIEYTGRHTTIHKNLKVQAEEGLARIATILDRASSAHVILTEDKYRMIAEVTVSAAGHKLVATCESAEMSIALHDALAKLEQQAIRLKGRSTTRTRHPKDDKNATNLAAAEAEGALAKPVKVAKRATVKKVAAKVSAARKADAMVVHSFPAAKNGKASVVEPHVVRSIDSAAMRAMTFEEAVKEAATRDRDVFVFRDHQMQVLILHRKRDGKVELIEVPG